ncbi:hypothetical protein [Candidatus Amarobacter glycogenicus]|uniref:hypothetical protein n=1 Tax=Candidatus Amarobacter glycogenicus TaxID=3140699 RepID=UPI002A0EC72F|nr:hypothetical protein [Dehalococcoidia bacterium]
MPDQRLLTPLPGDVNLGNAIFEDEDGVNAHGVNAGRSQPVTHDGGGDDTHGVADERLQMIAKAARR